MFSSQLRDLMAARTTWCMALVLSIIHSVVEHRGGPDAVASWFWTFGLSQDGVEKGYIWQVVTHGLLHGDWIHLGLNGVALLAIGSRLERIGGSALLIKIVLAGLLGGGAFHLLLSGSSSQCLVGVSGVVFAAILCLTSISPESRMWPVRVSGRNFGLGVLVASALLASLNPRLGWGGWSEWGDALDAWCGGFLFSTSHACHLGGAVGGLLCARWLLRPRVSLEQLQADRRRREEAAGLSAGER